MNFELFFVCNKTNWDDGGCSEKFRFDEVKNIINSETNISHGQIKIHPHRDDFVVEIWNISLVNLPSVIQGIEEIEFFEEWKKVQMTN